MACVTIMIVCVYGLEALVTDGPERYRALRVVAGVVSGYMVIYTFM